MISPKGLKAFKADASKMLTIAIAINDLFNTNELTLVRVLVQNIAFDSSNCVNDKHEETVIEVKRKIALLKLMYELNKYHIIGYIYDELSMNLQGIEMSEEDDDLEIEVKPKNDNNIIVRCLTCSETQGFDFNTLFKCINCGNGTCEDTYSNKAPVY